MVLNKTAHLTYQNENEYGGIKLFIMESIRCIAQDYSKNVIFSSERCW